MMWVYSDLHTTRIVTLQHDLFNTTPSPESNEPLKRQARDLLNTTPSPESNEPLKRRVRDTAVCVSGQLRSMNLATGDANFPPDELNPMITALRAHSIAGLTVVRNPLFNFARCWLPLTMRVWQAQSVQRNLYPAIGKFDVFMSVSTRGTASEPAVGDLSTCEPHRPTHGTLVCEVLKEVPVRVFPAKEVFGHYGYAGQHAQEEGLLQQLHGMHRCAAMIWKHMAQENVEYRYIMRLRPDMGVFAPLTANIATFLDDRLVIHGVDKGLCCCGNEDWFGIGHFGVMMPYLERMYSLQDSMAEYLSQHTWCAEDSMVWYMQQHFGVEVKTDLPLAGCLVKPRSRRHASDP